MRARLWMGLPVLASVAAVAAILVFVPVMPVPGFDRDRDYVVRIALPDAGATIGLPTVEGPPDASRPLVVIDPGHGGHDPGASGPNAREKELVLALGHALRGDLLRGGGIRVAMTRKDDRFLMLEERALIARKLGADLFLSIHADAVADKEGVSGASIYVLSDEASDAAAARLARRENDADRLNGVALASQNDTVSAILIDLSRRRASRESAEFAGLIAREGQGVMRFHPRPLRSAAFVVLKAPDVPSVLFEAGYITNPAEAERLNSDGGRAQFASVMARAIRIYFARQAGN